MSEKPRCHWDADAGWLTAEHRTDCSDPTCAGCRPCPKTHCAMRGRCPNHVDVEAGIVTCPGCVGRARSKLRRIVDLYTTDLPAEAEYAGINSDAFHLAGPVADIEQYAARQDWNREVAEAGDWRRGYCAYPAPRSDDDPTHPAVVLTSWEAAVREQYGPRTDLLSTVTSAADYLERQLAGPFPQAQEFEDFDADLARCLTRLEETLHDSRTPERGRPCPRCVEASDTNTGPRLRKRYAEFDKTGDPKALTGDLDTWHCPADASHWWSDADYRSRVAVDYVDHADRLTATQMIERFGVSAGSVRGWASKGEVRKRGKDHLGRQLYDVADVAAKIATRESA